MTVTHSYLPMMLNAFKKSSEYLHILWVFFVTQAAMAGVIVAPWSISGGDGAYAAGIKPWMDLFLS